MKSLKYILPTLALTLFMGLSTFAQKSKPVSLEFEVGGVCDMCKKRIEKTMDIAGVVFAEYELDTHTLSLVYKPNKIDEEKIHELLNEAGHDTEKSKATDEQYDAIHNCCKYREHLHNH
ncbi:MAG: mercuric ion binding protein [Flavobacteriales bacterium]|jgi:mercuric ion binding protein